MSAPPRWLRAAPGDTVAVALVDIAAGEQVETTVAREPIAAGHKVAVAHHPPGSAVIKLGQPIGVATTAIPPGAHVHTHNLRCEALAGTAVAPSDLPQPTPREAWFDGYRRADGRVGTRNFIGVLATVNCSAGVVRRVAQAFTPERLAAFPHVDGVVGIGHGSGCGMARSGPGIDNLRRTLAGYLRHPNFGGVVLIGLGCEVNQAAALLNAAGLTPGNRLRVLAIQDEGGTRAAIERGVAAVTTMLPLVDAARRERVPAAELTVGLQCGGSDGYSALTANPALGIAADLLVAAGGRVILSETPEIFGAERLLLARARSPEVAAKLNARLAWWHDHAARNGADLDNNPSPGNIAGGITTILEKSLGAVAKGGSTPLEAVVDYAEPVTAPGLSFMDTPGYDPCSATGQIAGGATLVAFTTGRGSVFGSKPAPTLKLASNSDLARRLADDIDVDCGVVLTGEASLPELGERIFDRLLRLASGERSASEFNDIGDDEFVPWTPGAAM